MADLEAQAEQNNKRREKAERKNKAFQSLQSELGGLRSDYKTLSNWQSLADAMGVSYDADATEHLKRDMEDDLRIVSNTDFEGFEDDQEIRDLEADFGTHHQKLNDRQRSIQDHIEERCEALLEELSTKRTVLRIPDVGSAEDETVIDNFQEFLRRQKQGNLHQSAATRYKELEAEYNDVEISFEAVQEEYDIGDKAMEELKKLLNNERVTLANIDGDVLNDLKNLSEFSQLLTIQFTEEK
ncbi:hypothetical protein SVXHr_2724 [Halorhabdus sp. SVX81]|nr:hypothetical protein SVXHr_2724 [Halorhabdus sp. SVX81]